MSNPPPLPPRDGEFDGSVERNLKDYSDLSAESKRLDVSEEPTYNVNDSVSKIAVMRQMELYSMKASNESSDLFIPSEDNESNILNKIQEIKLSLGEEDDTDEVDYWSSFVTNASDNWLSDISIPDLEAHLARGIPERLRPMVYLKTMQIKQTIKKEDYYDLLKKANNSSELHMQQIFIENFPIEKGLKDVLRVFTYYTNEVISRNLAKLDLNGDPSNNFSITEHNVAPKNFVIYIGRLLASLPNVESEEIFFLLLKFNKIFISLNKDEFLYKASRTLEDILPEVFSHIAKQGISLTAFYKSAIFTFLTDQIFSEPLLLSILDFFVFEGFDFLIRVILEGFRANADTICTLDGDALSDFIYSSEFFSSLASSEGRLSPTVLETEPNIIKYENEFYLLHANSLNANDHELANLKEVNDDLTIKIHELRRQIESLKETHSEIFGQADEYYSQLKREQELNRQLADTKTQLIEKYENLSMKENVKNTIKANEEFAARNADLESQISALQASLEEKRKKLAKSASAK